MNRNLISRVRKIEQGTFQPRWRVVVKDYDGVYRGECGEGLVQEQFDAWVRQQDKDTQVIIVEVCENFPLDSKAEKNVTLKVENHAGKNVEDQLKEYDEVLQKEERIHNGKENTIKVPDTYMPLLEDIRLLSADQQNPNRTTLRQQEQIWRSLEKYGWAYPIITNKDGVYADGEQRVEVCKQHNEFFVPVLRLPVNDIDRRMLRQTLNKLKGKHNKELDESEYIRLIKQGEKESLKAFLESVGERLPQDLGGESEVSVTIPGTWELIVECKDEAEQNKFFEKLKSEGYHLRILTL